MSDITGSVLLCLSRHGTWGNLFNCHSVSVRGIRAGEVDCLQNYSSQHNMQA